jgi:hypothetical protein
MSSSVSAIFNLERRLPRWQWVMACASVLACAVVPWLLRGWPLLLQCFASVGSAAMCLVGARRAGWLGGDRRLIRIIQAGSGEWHLNYANGYSSVTRLHASARYFRYFMWLRFESGTALLLGPGDLDADPFRRLQARLREPHAPEVRERVA